MSSTGAGEVHELERCGLSAASPAGVLLDQVLDRLDVVIGGRLDRLDGRGIVFTEGVGDVLRGGQVRRPETAQFRNVPLGGEAAQPGDLDPHAGVDQPLLAEDLPQFGAARGVAPVHGRERGQGSEAHGQSGRCYDPG
jgi:hypothetical protein